PKISYFVWRRGGFAAPPHKKQGFLGRAAPLQTSPPHRNAIKKLDAYGPEPLPMIIGYLLLLPHHHAVAFQPLDLC
ncbi:MAG TPA: hypothetical protein VFU22_12280, partial [Roseiflexaceae bacterium]|nr:hypothetical protein [Roseiflexaceae bacterium]